jgi:hypothetical protein
VDGERLPWVTLPPFVCFVVATFIDPAVILAVPFEVRGLLRRGWPGWKSWAWVAGVFGVYSIIVVHTVGYALSAVILAAPCAFVNAHWDRVVENCHSPIYELYGVLLYWALPTPVLWVAAERVGGTAGAGSIGGFATPLTWGVVGPV